MLIERLLWWFGCAGWQGYQTLAGEQIRGNRLFYWEMFLLTGEDSSPQVCNNNIEIRWNAYPKDIFPLYGSEFEQIYTYKESHEFIFHPNFESQKQTSILKMDWIRLPSFLVFVKHGCFQHVCVDVLRSGSSSYHVYLFHNNTLFRNSIIYNFSCILQIARPRNECLSQETKLDAPNKDAAFNVSIVKKQNKIDFKEIFK